MYPDAWVMVLASVSRVPVMEESLGATSGPKNVRALVEHYLELVESRL